MSIGIVMLAAGEAKRFGAAKLVLPIGGVSLVRRATLAALAVRGHVVVVTGAHREAVDACIADLAVVRAFNANWANGIGGSIARGIAALPAICEAAIIALADQVLIGADEFGALIAAHACAPQYIIAAQFGDVIGPPCLFPRAFFGELVELVGDRGARTLLRQHARCVQAVTMPAAAIDIDTPADLAALGSRTGS